MEGFTLWILPKFATKLGEGLSRRRFRNTTTEETFLPILVRNLRYYNHILLVSKLSDTAEPYLTHELGTIYKISEGLLLQ
jgi:hypothetical protein